MNEQKDTIELIVAPSTLEEFLQEETPERERELDIHQTNLKSIQEGNKELEEIYGGIESARMCVTRAERDLKKYLDAKKSLTEGDKTPTIDLLDKKIAELNRVANSNLKHEQFDSARRDLTEMNAFRSLRAKYSTSP